MVKGYDKFKLTFQKYADQFILIGGTACDYQMEDVGLEFRATKDLDIVLIVEALTPQFVKTFWDFIKKGGYSQRERSSGKKEFFRFLKPNDESHPFMIELFARKSNLIEVPEDIIIAPIPTSDEVSSLSAILLDDNYYDFVKEHRNIRDGIPMVDTECLILLKANAWMNLSERKNRGEKVKGRDIKKHKCDIIRLYQLLPAGGSIELPNALLNDMNNFMVKYEQESNLNPSQFGVNLSKENFLKRLKNYFHLVKQE
ncbi:MAG: hypothetical protein APR54_03615 [Candidatus Cloacimonas sp. SDB]|nr:MAG: hypothetical protein APR54_03615 [Candidatus Cloacimonas sp. SDB]